MAEIGYPWRARLLRSPVGRRLIGPLVTRRGAGLITVLLSAIGIGAVTPYARLALDAGVEIVALMTVRYALALLAVAVYLVWSRQSWRLTAGHLRQAMGLAAALGLLSLAYFASVRRIPASMAALIYYTYPILVSIAAYRAWRSQVHHRRDPITLAGQALSLAGLILILGFAWSSLDLVGVLLAASSAVMITLIHILGDRLMRSVPSMVLSLHVALFNAALFSAITMTRGASIVPQNHQAWVGMAGVSVFFVAGFIGMFIGVRLLGPSQAACIKNAEPLAAIAVSIALLGERYGVWQLVGAGVVIVGMIVACSTFSTQSKHDVVHRLSETGEPASLENCTPLCRLGSRCLLA